MDAVDDITSWLRRSEYTGENRCMPCTVVNSGIAAVGSVGLGMVTWALTSVVAGIVTGLAALAAGATLIYFRGYLIPGTPTLTERYFPPWLLSLFGKQSDIKYRADGNGDVDQEAILVDAGALEECADRDDLCLSASFRTQWYDEIDDVAASEDYDGLFKLLEVDGGDITTLSQNGENFQAQVDGSFVGTWKSRAMFLADVSAATIMAREYGAWTEYGPYERHELLSGLRLFIDRCPACGGDVGFGTETVETCCQSRDVAVIDCQDCGGRLFETRSLDE